MRGIFIRWLVVHLGAVIVEAAIADLAELVRVHAGIGGDLVDLLHRRRIQIACSAVDEGALVGILPCLAIVVHKLELWLVCIILSNNVPILPEFYDRENKTGEGR